MLCIFMSMACGRPQEGVKNLDVMNGWPQGFNVSYHFKNSTSIYFIIYQLQIMTLKLSWH